MAGGGHYQLRPLLFFLRAVATSWTTARPRSAKKAASAPTMSTARRPLAARSPVCRCRESIVHQLNIITPTPQNHRPPPPKTHSTRNTSRASNDNAFATTMNINNTTDGRQALPGAQDLRLGRPRGHGVARVQGGWNTRGQEPGKRAPSGPPHAMQHNPTHCTRTSDTAHPTPQRILNKTNTLTSQQAWFEQHQRWLVPYAAFCFLRDLFGTAEHWSWGAMATPTPELLARLTSERLLRAVFCVQCAL